MKNIIEHDPKHGSLPGIWRQRWFNGVKAVIRFPVVSLEKLFFLLNHQNFVVVSSVVYFFFRPAVS
jgi:hypothetical protein